MRYFSYTKIPDLIKYYPIRNKSGMTDQEINRGNLYEFNTVWINGELRYLLTTMYFSMKKWAGDYVLQI